jgi:hypothetical protein
VTDEDGTAQIHESRMLNVLYAQDMALMTRLSTLVLIDKKRKKSESRSGGGFAKNLWWIARQKVALRRAPCAHEIHYEQKPRSFARCW